MLLAVDIGNTNITLGVFEAERLIGYWRIATCINKTYDEYAALIKELLEFRNYPLDKITGAIICSVVPKLAVEFKKLIKKYLNQEALIVGENIDAGIVNLYDDPKQVGADRLANAVAAYQLYKSAAIVVDFGTATTFDAISEAGEYLGGVISAGVGISAQALAAHTAKLPQVELSVKPAKVIGTTTEGSIQAGLYWGSVGSVEEIIKRMKQEISAQKIKVIATGGLAQLIAKDCPAIEIIEPFLTLQGLRIIYEKRSC